MGKQHDPMKVETIAEFILAMDLFRIRNGQPSLRKMVKNCERFNLELADKGLDKVVPRTIGTFSQIGKDTKMPTWETLRAYIAGASKGDISAVIADLEVWEKAWKKLLSDNAGE